MKEAAESCPKVSRNQENLLASALSCQATVILAPFPGGLFLRSLTQRLWFVCSR